IILPKLFDGRNRAFFMMSYEGEKENSNGVITSTVPLPEWRTGNFSSLRNSQGAPVIIYDPRTTRLGTNGTYIRDAFPGNIIPSDRINPIAAKVGALYPNPLSTGIGPNHLTTYAKLAPGG